MRDWQATLWPGSFGGAGFLIEKVKGSFGKRVVVHEFPNRDDPFVEELGAAAQKYDVVCYLADDFADIEADGLTATLLTYGPQILIGADTAPTLCMFEKATRDHDRDKLGYVGFSLNFLVYGSSIAMPSGDMLGQLTLDAAAAMGPASLTLTANLSL